MSEGDMEIDERKLERIQERRELFKSVAIALVIRGIGSPELGKDIAREILKAADEFEKEQEK